MEFKSDKVTHELINIMLNNRRVNKLCRIQNGMESKYNVLNSRIAVVVKI